MGTRRAGWLGKNVGVMFLVVVSLFVSATSVTVGHTTIQTRGGGGTCSSSNTYTWQYKYYDVTIHNDVFALVRRVILLR